MRLVRLLAALIGTSVVAPQWSGAQEAGASAAQLNVFLDCRAGCDSDLIRTEIEFVNWVRDRTVADVHVLLTELDAGAGGEQITIAFLGLRALASRGDTLTVTTNPTTTSDERRRAIVQALTLGLVQFAARTPTAGMLRVTQREGPGMGTPTQTTPANDPWKAWVFELDLSGSVDGERYYRSRDMNAGFNANRTTEEWKIDLSYEFSYNDERATVQEFDTLGIVSSEETFANLQRDWDTDLLIVKSLTRHWSAGFEGRVASNTFVNQRLSTRITTGLEYNIFPYTESTRRELTFQYGVGIESFQYADTTIFDKTRESLPRHFASVNYSTRQPWGSTNVRLEHSNYLTDATKRRTEVNGELDIRLFRGLSLNLGGEYSWIRDQIYLRKGRRDAVDVLLRRRELLTGFQYDFNIGLSYTFGSIFNNIVNPRF